MIIFIRFRYSAFLLVADTRLFTISFWKNVKGYLTRKSSDCLAFLLFAFPSAFENELKALLEMQKPEPNDSGFPCREEYRIIEPDLGGVGGI